MCVRVLFVCDFVIGCALRGCVCVSVELWVFGVCVCVVCCMRFCVLVCVGVLLRVNLKV